MAEREHRSQAEFFRTEPVPGKAGSGRLFDDRHLYLCPSLDLMFSCCIVFGSWNRERRVLPHDSTGGRTNTGQGGCVLSDVGF